MGILTLFKVQYKFFNKASRMKVKIIQYKNRFVARLNRQLLLLIY